MFLSLHPLLCPLTAPPAPPLPRPPGAAGLSPSPAAATPLLPRDKEADAEPSPGAGEWARGPASACPGARVAGGAVRPRHVTVRSACRRMPACRGIDLFLLRAGRVVYLVVPFPRKGGLDLLGTGVYSCLLPPALGWALGVWQGATPPRAAPPAPPMLGCLPNPLRGCSIPMGLMKPCLAVPLCHGGAHCASVSPAVDVTLQRGSNYRCWVSPRHGVTCTPGPPFCPHRVALMMARGTAGVPVLPGGAGQGWVLRVLGCFPAVQQQIRGWKAASGPGSSPRLLAGAAAPRCQDSPFPSPRKGEKNDQVNKASLARVQRGGHPMVGGDTPLHPSARNTTDLG